MKRVLAVLCAGGILAAAGLAVPLLAAAPAPPRQVVRPITGPLKTPPKPALNPVPLYVKVDPATLTGEQRKSILKIHADTEAAIQKLLAAEHQRVLAALSDKQKAALDQADLKDNLDSMSEMGETESLRLQMAMDRVSKFMQTLSNIEKKMSDTDSNIIQNIK